MLSLQALTHVVLCTLAGLAQGTRLYAATYDGNLTTLSLTYKENITVSNNAYVNNGYFNGFAPAKEYDLKIENTFNTSLQDIAWLTLNPQNNLLYLVTAPVVGNGTMVSYRTSPTAFPVELESIETLLDGAYIGFYANGNAIAVAHYNSSALQTYWVGTNGSMTPLETFTYHMNGSGPAGDRQAGPHPHMAFTDPTGDYLLVNDLGADLVRVYSIDKETGLLTVRDSLSAAPGSGPRHGVFTQNPLPTGDGSLNYIFYLDAEIAGTVTAYKVTYLENGTGLQFDELTDGLYRSLAPYIPDPDPEKRQGHGIPAEIRISPDGNFLVVSNRRDGYFNGTLEQYPPNGTSDSISTFRIREDLGGSLDFVQAVPGGGSVLRSLVINKAGTLAAVGVQLSHKITILERDVRTGLFTNMVADIDIGGEIWTVIWDE